jgi:hypothetical protein
MTTNQRNYLNMVNAVLSLYDSNPAAWKELVAVAGGVEKLRATLLAIIEAAKQQDANDSKGYTAAKERVRDLLENLTYQSAVRVRSFAAVTDNEVLREVVLFSRSDLDNMNTNELLTHCRVVADVCEANVTELADYRIDEKTVEDLRQRIEQTAQLYAKRDTVIDLRMENTDRLKQLFLQARKQLKALDDLAEGFVDDDTFVAAYFNARRIHDLHGRKAATTEKAVTAETTQA